MSYESPITLIMKQMRTEQENGIMKAICEQGVIVDKEELLKALRYDRDQYMKGYADGRDDGANRWIPVEERLPDPGKYDWVLGAVKTTEKPEGENWYLPPHVVECRGGEWWGMDSEFPLKDLREEVTHWMPLPELPVIEADDVRRGYWVAENTRPNSSQFICSSCRGRCYYIQPTRNKTWKKCCPYKYCPNCGAKMEGK